MKADRETIVVDCDWSSTGIWIRGSDGRTANTNYDWLNLPPWLIARYEYWTWWYNRWEPWEKDAKKGEPDDVLFEAYGLSLAMDTKRIVGSRYRVEFRNKEIILPHPKNLHEVYDHLSPDTQPEDSSWMQYFPIPEEASK